MKKSIASILCVLSFVAFAAPTVSYQTATNIAKKVIDQTLGDALAAKRDRSDLAVYSVTRTENTDWTWTSDNAELASALNDGGNVPIWDEEIGTWVLDNEQVDGYQYEYGGSDLRNATDVQFTFSQNGVYFDATATRPRYMDETLGPAKPNQQLAAVSTDDAAKPADGSLMKYDAANDRFVKATAGTDFYKDGAIGDLDAGLIPFYKGVTTGSVRDKINDLQGHVNDLTIDKADRATTLSGYGITDGATKTELAAAVSTNNPAFVSAVRNTPTENIPEDMPTDWGTYGTVGAALAALAAFVKWAKAKIVAVIGDNGKPTDQFATDLLGKPVAISAMHYALGAAITASTKLDDRTTNFVNALSTLTDPIDLTFPDAVTGKCRDFLVRVHRATGGVAVSFTAPTGAVIYGDGFSTAIGENEDWLFAITETAANEWCVRAIKLEIAA